MTFPYDSGQSGTERPDSVDVTRPPATISPSVAAAVTTAKRCRAMLRPWTASPMGGDRPSRRRLVLGPVVVGAALRRAVLVRPAVNGRDVVEVLVGRRRRCLPLERVGSPRVVPRGLPAGDN